MPAVRALGRRSRAAAATMLPVLLVDGIVPYSTAVTTAYRSMAAAKGALCVLSLRPLVRLLRPLRPPVRPALVGPRAWLAGRTETFSGASHLQSDVDTHGCALPCVLIGVLLLKCALKCITAVGFGPLQAAAEGVSRCTTTEFLLCPVLSVCTWLTVARSEASTKTLHVLTRSRATRSRAHTLTLTRSHTLQRVAHTTPRRPIETWPSRSMRGFMPQLPVASLQIDQSRLAGIWPLSIPDWRYVSSVQGLQPDATRPTKRSPRPGRAFSEPPARHCTFDKQRQARALRSTLYTAHCTLAFPPSRSTPSRHVKRAAQTAPAPMEAFEKPPPDP